MVQRSYVTFKRWNFMIQHWSPPERGATMSTHAKGTFEIKNWDEHPYNEVEGAAKVTRASVEQAFQGEIEGEGHAEYLMAYREDKTATYVGLQRVVGKLGGRSGAFVLQLDGAYDGKKAHGSWSVVPGSGTGELSGLKGKGGFEAPPGMTAQVTLDYDFD
jgi:hypothetical protein